MRYKEVEMTNDDQPTEAADGVAKAPQDLGSLAMRDIRRARKLVSADKGGESIPAQANHLVGLANALALLDLAAAIREHKSG
jgi:hypothetical protein